MDLLMIARNIWRYKLVTLPALVLTMLGVTYVLAVKQPVYEAKSSFVLLNPPSPPTAEAIASNPALARVRTDNPYTRFGDQTVVINVLASTLDGDAARRGLVRAGADSRYTVAPNADFGYSSPIVQVTALGATPEAAIRTADIVDDAVIKELDRMQEAQGVDERYRIKAIEVDHPDKAELQASGKLRMLIGVLVLGAVLLFIVVSAADALATLRTERSERAAQEWVGETLGEPWSVYSDRTDDSREFLRDPGSNLAALETQPPNGHPPRDFPYQRKQQTPEAKRNPR